MTLQRITQGVKVSSDKEATKAIATLAKSIKASDLREPHTPAKDLLSEGRRISKRIASDEKPLLNGSFYKKSDGVLLGALVSTFSDATATLFSAQAPNLPSKVSDKRDEAEALLTDVWADLSYIADETGDDDLSAKLSRLREGHSLDDTVEDLELTVPLLKKYKTLLAALNDDAKETSARLTKLHVALTGHETGPDDQDAYDAAKEWRDRVGLILESHLARIRTHGKRAFKADAKRAGQYVDFSRDSSSPPSPPVAPKT